jgi:hypothetical protein
MKYTLHLGLSLHTQIPTIDRHRTRRKRECETAVMKNLSALLSIRSRDTVPFPPRQKGKRKNYQMASPSIEENEYEKCAFSRRRRATRRAISRINGTTESFSSESGRSFRLQEKHESWRPEKHLRPEKFL